MNSERTALLAIVTVALLAALIAAPAVAGEITANDTPADDEILTMATAGDTPPLPNAAPGLAVAEGAVTITAAGTSVPAFAAGVGSDEGWYRIQCNVDGANVYFDGQYMGITSGGQLYVPVYTTGSPYSTIRIEKSGYHTYTASLPSGPAAGETREVYVTLQPVAPGDTVTTVSVSGVPDNASFSLTIRNVFATTPGEAFEFTIRDLSLPFSLTSGEMNVYTRGTTWTQLSAELPDGGSVSMCQNADANDEVRITLPRNLPNGTSVPLTFRGEALGDDIVADFTVIGTKQGPDDGQISFTIEGIEQGTMTGSVYVDGSEILSWGGSSGGGAPIPTPMPTPTPMWTPTPSQTPAVPRDLGITSNKDTVIRGNSFCVTITGESRKYYDLTITNTTNALSPVIAPGQVDVTKRNDYNASVRTTAAGTRTVQFNTNSTTRCATYIIRVADSDDRDNKYDEVQVRVDEGAVTITASGTGVYYI
ncbi:PEGA domain-containing protein, partial [Methanoculleus sp.]|uniref:PEGA domain-containing protein n=1 Tax=Methanoculleus sp. TaxID=90427 RepID=UPI0026013939